ncbi:right-handed parallel beta-helix repeat-containing protein, partial [bacterium]|nr:right-handed parallel beta-helix repeat-containing protein [bacterium]
MPAVELRAVGLVLFLLLTLAQASFAQLSGPLSGTLGPGELHVVGNIWIESGDSLRLMPGTTFHFDGDYSFGIYGILLAEGTETDSIVFTTDTTTNPERWPDLRFEGSNTSGSRLVYCLIENGLAYFGGGVHCRNGASPNFSKCTVRSNSANAGGGIYCSSSSPIFTDCIITGNSAIGSGGGVDCFLASPSFINCIITGNSSDGDGGGVADSDGSFLHCVISNNSCSDKGAAFHCSHVSVIVSNCIISSLHNEAIYFADSPESHFENCCIVRPGGTVITYEWNDPNEGPPGIGELVMTNANNDSCDIYENIFLGPRFVDGLAGDFHLADYSPCIGAGQVGGPAEDMDGDPRPNPPGSYPDIGAYENALAAPGPFEGLSGALSGIMGPGVYPISDTIYVNEGETLRLLPGTTFLFGGPYSFEINGTLLAEGTEGDSIFFTSDIPLPNPGLGLHFSGEESSGSQLTYCVFEYGYSTGGGINDHGGAAYCDYASPTFTHCVFRYNGARSLGGAVYCISSSASFSNCTFTYNVAYGGGGVHCYHYSPVTFTNCSFIGNAVYGATSYGGAISCYESRPSFT